jgi:hypothetical protein
VVILYYNSVGFTDTASIISLIEAYARDLPEPVAVAQFYDHETEADLPKWLIVFDNLAGRSLIYMSRARVFTPPLPHVIPPNTSFNAYVINTNGLNPTRCAPLSPGTNLVKLNKLKMLRDLATERSWMQSTLLKPMTRNQ